MAKRRCIQCDKELPNAWSDSPSNRLDPVCPECALRNLRKKSIRRRRVLDTSVRKKVNLNPASEADQPRKQPSTRTDIPMNIELDTDDPMLLAAHGETDQGEGKESTEDVEQDIDVEETTQVRKPKPPPEPGPQIKLNF